MCKKTKKTKKHNPVNLDTGRVPFTRMASKQITDLNVKMQNHDNS